MTESRDEWRTDAMAAVLTSRFSTAHFFPNKSIVKELPQPKINDIFRLTTLRFPYQQDPFIFCFQERDFDTVKTLHAHSFVQANFELRHLHRLEQVVLHPHFKSSEYDSDIFVIVIHFGVNFMSFTCHPQL